MKLEFSKQGIGERIRKLRSDKGLTQIEFCEKNSLKTAGNLSAIEKGRAFPTLDAILNICEHSGVSSDFLLFGKPDEKYIDNIVKFQNAQNALKQVLDRYRSILRSDKIRLEFELEAAQNELKVLDTNRQAYESGYYKFNKEDGALDLYRNLKHTNWLVNTLRDDINKINQHETTLDSDLKVLTETFLE